MKFICFDQRFRIPYLKPLYYLEEKIKLFTNNEGICYESLSSLFYSSASQEGKVDIIIKYN